MRFGPEIQVGPLTGTLFWLFVILVAIGVIGTVTMSGLLVWTIGALLLVSIVWVVGTRVLGKGAGRR